ncbi:hypothetical protein Tco_0991874 [Tanacetum coccineum]|uniref:Reverse transcriptase domain-containing protein n=1 Tax=Tanacetum coccineum TaxID=301880 RepID=A0ABQ5F1T7_9ASTR
MSNSLWSGGNKMDEGLPEDTSAGQIKSARKTHIRNHLITWFSTRSHSLAQPNSNPRSTFSIRNTFCTNKLAPSVEPEYECKFNKEKERNEKLKEVKARLNFEGCSRTSSYSDHNQRSYSRYTEALSEILYEHCFNRLRLEIKNQLVSANTPLVGFSGEIIWPIGQIQLLVKIGDEEHSTLAWMNFVVVRSPSPHNGIIGRPGFRKLQAVPSTAYGMLKLPVEGGVITLKSSKMVPLECAMVSRPEGNPPVSKQIVK